MFQVFTFQAFIFQAFMDRESSSFREIFLFAY